MTAKCCLWIRWVQQNKRYLWLYALNGIILLWMGPGNLMFSPSIGDTVYCDVVHKIGPNNTLFEMLIFLGVLAGIYGFSYLHSQKKVDFYHSQPVSDTNRFLNGYSSGLLCCYIPYGIAFVLNLVVVKSFGILDFDLFQKLLASTMLGMLLYFAAYHVAILMTIITGNVLYSAALTGCVFLYEIIFRKIMEEYKGFFFQHYSYNGNREALQCKWSPVWALLQKIEDISELNSSKEMWEVTGSTCIRVVILSIIIGGIAYLAYKKRPLEYNGPSFAFQRLKSVVKVVIIIPVSALFVDMYFTQWEYDSVSNREIRTFFVSCVILFLVIGICHLLFEFLWELDIRAVKKHLLSTMVAFAGSVVLFGSFYFDWFGYDDYVPDSAKVESVGVEIDNFWDVKEVGIEANMTCVDEACKAASEICDRYLDEDSFDPEGSYMQADFVFRMKNGTSCYRSYRLEVKDGENPMSYLLNNESYKKETYPFIYDDSCMETLVSKIKTSKHKVHFSWEDKSYVVGKRIKVKSQEQLEKLRQALRADFEEHANNTVYTSQYENIAIGCLNIEYAIDRDRYASSDYLIFPEYTRTIECLKEMGVKTDPACGFDMEKIDSVTLCNSDMKLKKKITEKEKQRELLSYVINMWQPEIWKSFEHSDNDSYRIDVKFVDEETDSYRLSGKDLPDWVTEMFEK